MSAAGTYDILLLCQTLLLLSAFFVLTYYLIAGILRAIRVALMWAAKGLEIAEQGGLTSHVYREICEGKPMCEAYNVLFILFGSVIYLIP